MEQITEFFSSKDDRMTNKMINSLALRMEAFIYKVYRDEQVDPLVVDCSLNLVNHYYNQLIMSQRIMFLPP